MAMLPFPSLEKSRRRPPISVAESTISLNGGMMEDIDAALRYEMLGGVHALVDPRQVKLRSRNSSCL